MKFRHPRTLGLALVLTVAGTAATAYAAQFKLGAEAAGPRTGFAGSSSHALRAPTAQDYQGMFELTVWGHGHEARMKTRHINPNITKSAKWTGGTGYTAKASDAHTLTFSASNTFVRGANVCVPPGDVAGLQGVKLYGVRLNPNTGALTNLSEPKTYTRSACDGKWKTPVYCPKGKIVSGIELRLDDDVLDQPVVRGIKLLCRKVNKQ